MAKYSALDIAHWFIDKNETAIESMGGEKITLLKLLKLLYYAEGSSLALENGSLFDDDIVAWEHGPVIVNVYNSYSDPYDLGKLKTSDYEGIEKINDNRDDQSILNQVFDVFGQYSAWALRNKTHSEDPWRSATNDGREFNAVIDRGVMKEYFKKEYVS